MTEDRGRKAPARCGGPRSLSSVLRPPERSELLRDPTEWANGLVAADVPFELKGRDRTGIDCYGVVKLGHLECAGRALRDFFGEYPEQGIKGLDAAIMREARGADWVKVDLAGARALDVLTMSVAGHPLHVALVIRPRRMVHVMRRARVVSVDYTQFPWWGQILGAWRHIQMTDDG